MIKNFSRTTPIDYQCVADNGIPPRDTRTKRLFPTSKYLFFFLLHKKKCIVYNCMNEYSSVL